MRRSIGIVVVLAAAVAVISLVSSALADSGNGDRVLRGQLIGSTPPLQGGPTLFGVTPPGAPWVVAASDVDARRNGRIEVKVRGLMIPGRGTAGIPAVTASLYCGGTLVGTTAAATLSTDGDAEIRDTIAASPAQCLAPTVFVSPDGRPLTYFAVTGA